MYLWGEEVRHPGISPGGEDDVRRERMRASWEAMGGTDEAEVKDDLTQRRVGRHRRTRGQPREPNIDKHPPPSSAAIMDVDLKLPGQPIQTPRGPAPQLSNGVYSRDGQVRASLVGIPVYKASVRLHQST